MKVSDILKRSAARFGPKPCAALGGSSSCVLTYESTWHVLLQHRAWLTNRISFRNNKKLVVAYLSGNSIDFLLSMLACMGLASENVTVALLNTRWTPSEMAAALQTRDPRAWTILLYGSGFQDTAQKASSLLSHDYCSLSIPLFSEQSMTKLLTRMPGSIVATGGTNDEDIDYLIQQVAASEDGQEDAVIVFTSGTTSGSKGVRLSHKALYVQALVKLRQPCGYSTETRMLASTVPLFHVGGLSSTLSVLLAGGTWVLPSSSNGFDPVTVLESVSSPILPVNTLVVVPAMLHSILEQIPSNGCKYDSVRLLLIGGQSASPETLRRSNRIFPNARIVQTFACTEAASSLTFLEIQSDHLDSLTLSLSDVGHTGDCVGIPPPHIQLTLVDKDKKESVVRHPYKIGIFATRGSHVMNGYWKRDNSNLIGNLGRDSWYVTSDLGFRDEQGRFFFCGRTKDIIRTGGETVIALEVERALLCHPDIRECAVFALPDKRFGEAVCAAIVLNNEGALTVSDTRAFCTKHGLAGYKKPRTIFVVKELPRNSAGKVLKHKLVECCRQEEPPVRSKL